MTADLAATFHASQAPKWLSACLVRLDNEERQGLEGATHVGVELGNRVHGRMTGHQHTPAAAIAYDERTRSEKELNRQVDWVSARVKEWFDAREYELHERVFDSEVDIGERLRVTQGGKLVEMNIASTLDWLLGFGEHHSRFLDLKTGKREPLECWPQMAVYAYMWSLRRPPLIEGGYLWVPRGNRDVAPVVKFRPFDKLAEFGSYIISERLKAVTKRVYRPSVMSCTNCQLAAECAVAAA